MSELTDKIAELQGLDALRGGEALKTYEYRNQLRRQLTPMLIAALAERDEEIKRWESGETFSAHAMQLYEQQRAEIKALKEPCYCCRTSCEAGCRCHVSESEEDYSEASYDETWRFEDKPKDGEKSVTAKISSVEIGKTKLSGEEEE